MGMVTMGVVIAAEAKRPEVQRQVKATRSSADTLTAVKLTLDMDVDEIHVREGSTAGRPETSGKGTRAGSAGAEGTTCRSALARARPPDERGGTPPSCCAYDEWRIRLIRTVHGNRRRRASGEAYFGYP